jgi:threonyl-tRNA synthetase
MLVLGEKERQAESVAVRQHRKGDLGAMPRSEFIARVSREISEKLITM